MDCARPFAVLLSIALLAAGCGGGGDGSAVTTPPPPPPPPVTPGLTFSPGAVSATTYAGAAGNISLIAVMTTAAAAVAHHIEYQDPADLVDSITRQSSSGPATDLLIRTRAGLGSGAHQGTLKFYICLDDACTSSYAGSPFDLPISVNVQPRPPLQVAPAQLSLSVEQLRTLAVTLDVTVPVDGPLAFGASDADGRFATAVTVAAVNGRVHSLRINTSQLGPEGSYTGSLVVHTCAANPCIPFTAFPGGSATIPYSITVLPLPKVLVSPTAIAVTVEQGDPIKVPLQVTIPPPQAWSLRMRDSATRFHSFSTQSSPGPVYTLLFEATAINTPGTYSGTLTLANCPEPSCDNALAMANVGVAIPYTITVTPESFLQPVPTQSGLPEWETFQGNAGHTGFVPVTLDPAAFAQKWIWSPPAFPQQYPRLRHATTGSGKVVVADAGDFRDDTLYALDEANGTVAWQHKFATNATVQHPAAWGGRVFVVTSGGGDPAMWSFDLATGTRLSSESFFWRSMTPDYLAPVVKGGIVYSHGTSTTFGGMYAFKGSTGTHRWWGGTPYADLWSPAVDDDLAYAHTGGELTALNRHTGQKAFSIPNNGFVARDMSLNTAPVLPGNGSIVVVDALYETPNVIADNNLIAYDAPGRVESWRVAGKFASVPAVAGNVVYVLNALTSRLDARSLATGQLLWSWAPPLQFESIWLGNLVVTNNLLFVSTNKATHAIDLSTHQSVWNHAATGKLALSSNSVLYVTSNEQVTAIALK